MTPPSPQHQRPVSALEFLGHAAVRLIASDGTHLVIDPFVAGGFDGRMGYGSIDDPADLVWATHQHADHAAYDQVPGDPEVIEEPGEYGPFSVSTWTLAHDEYGGRRRGGLVDVTRVAFDERVVVHLSDVGQSPPSRIPRAFRQPDVLLATCGGFFTIGAAQAWEWSARIAAGVTIPIHCKTDRCELPIRARDVFAAHWRKVREPVGHRIELGAELFSFGSEVLPMAHKL